jgi:hypothetical protein
MQNTGKQDKSKEYHSQGFDLGYLMPGDHCLELATGSLCQVMSVMANLAMCRPLGLVQECAGMPNRKGGGVERSKRLVRTICGRRG